MPIEIPFDYNDTIISQYGNSPRLRALIDDFDLWVGMGPRVDQFYDYMYNIETAKGYGLDVWGRIVGVQRILEVAVGDYLGFEEAIPGSDPWNQGPWYSGQPVTSNYALSDDAFRLLILCKALANICDGSIPAYNNLLMMLFPGRGNVYVTEGGVPALYLGFKEATDPGMEQPWNQGIWYSGQSLDPMTMTYTFTFQPTPVEVSIIFNSGVLPRPTGVEAFIVIL